MDTKVSFADAYLLSNGSSSLGDDAFAAAHNAHWVVEKKMNARNLPRQ